MARPPTALSILFYRSRDARMAYRLLRSHGALSWKGWLHKSKTIALLHSVIESDRLEYEAHGPPAPGASTPDRMADELLRSPYLSKRGHRMNEESPPR